MNLFKLKKDGKTVGYARVGCSIGQDIQLHVSTDLNLPLKKWRLSTKKYIQADEALPYVTDDRNGDKVFARDKVFYAGYKAIIKQNDGDFGYHLEFMDLTVMEPIKTDKKLTNLLHREMFKEIELLKDKDE